MDNANAPHLDESVNYARTDQIFQRMQAMGYTVPKLAQQCGMRASTLRHKLNGRGQFRISEQARICAVLKFSKEEEYEIFTEPYDLLCHTLYTL